jgi:hypothetical protein
MKELVKKLAKIQSTLKAPKNQFNKFGNYSYRSCEDILEAVKPLLAAEDLVLTIADEVLFNPGGENYIKVTTTITDGKDSISNSAVAREAQEQKGMNPAQISGSSSSYARKYALNGLFLIDDTKDADATNTHGRADVTKTEQDLNVKKVESIASGVITGSGMVTNPIKSFKRPTKTTTVSSGDDL